MGRMIVYIMFLTLVTYNNLNAQVSPGKLSEAHSDLEGIANCTKCHILGDDVSNDKCLDCHRIVRNLIAEKKG